MQYIRHIQTPLGGVTLAGDGTSLCGLWFDGQNYFPRDLVGYEAALPVFEETVRWLAIYFRGKEPDFLPPLSPQGTPFQAAVWQLLTEIPYGHTLTYGALAARLGRPRAAQAVGGAVARNPISLLIPCHRVLGAGGALTGYAGGLWRKEALLALERGQAGR